jgi:hypothetical protein
LQALGPAGAAEAQWDGGERRQAEGELVGDQQRAAEAAEVEGARARPVGPVERTGRERDRQDGDDRRGHARAERGEVGAAGLAQQVVEPPDGHHAEHAKRPRQAGGPPAGRAPLAVLVTVMVPAASSASPGTRPPGPARCGHAVGRATDWLVPLLPARKPPCGAN